VELLERKESEAEHAQCDRENREASRESRVLCVPVDDWQIDESTRHRRQHDTSTGQPRLHFSVTYHVCGSGGRTRTADQASHHADSEEPKLAEVALAERGDDLNQEEECGET